MDNYNNSYQSLLNTDITLSQLSTVLSRVLVLESYFNSNAYFLLWNGTNKQYILNNHPRILQYYQIQILYIVL